MAYFSLIGDKLNGESNGDFFGFSTVLSGNGNVVAIGAPLNEGNETSSKVYYYVNGYWTANAPNDLSGVFKRVGADLGSIKVFEKKDGSWQTLGNEIIESETSFQGTSLSLSTDGSVLAVTAFTGSQEVVRIYNLVDNQWQQIGNNIVGNSGFDYHGYSTSLSSDGSILAIGAFWDDRQIFFYR